MNDTAIIALPDAEKTRFTGSSFARTLHSQAPIYVTGAVGAGKTTFLQGLGEALDLPEPVLSPTFALAHPHPARDGSVAVTHLDLYRLDEAQAADFMQKFHWEGPLWIEWADRLPRSAWVERFVHAHLLDDGAGRRLELEFADVPLPSSAQIAAWREEVGTPPNVIAHCETVGAVAEACAKRLLQKGVAARPRFAKVGGQLHDMLRFLDFRPGGPPDMPAALARWAPWRERFQGLRHEAAMALFLHDAGYPELGEAVRTHGILPPAAEGPRTVEQELIFYADKRALGSKIVSVQDRFDDFAVRYADSGQTSAWVQQTLALEHSLFPNGAPTAAELSAASATGA